jgi:uncharacterized NAD(P)/FAD-binding protein YdhS
MSLQVIHQAVVAISSNENFFEMVDNLDRKTVIDKVVLALRDFTACSQAHLAHCPSYFRSPWLLQKLDRIDKKSSVCMIGSRLSAVNAATHIVDDCHDGPLILVFRSGRLPKVQGCHLAAP